MDEPFENDIRLKYSVRVFASNKNTCDLDDTPHLRHTSTKPISINGITLQTNSSPNQSYELDPLIRIICYTAVVCDALSNRYYTVCVFPTCLVPARRMCLIKSWYACVCNATI